MSQYGITVADYEQMLVQQESVCAICKRPETDNSKRGRVRLLAVDHNHKTLLVRGLLCRKCNTVLGLMDEDIDRLRMMTKYLIEREGS